MKNAAKLSEQKVVPVDVQNVKLNVKHFKNETVGPSGFAVFLNFNKIRIIGNDDLRLETKIIFKC